MYWVINTEEDFKFALQTSASGIMTDRPAYMQKFMSDN